MPGTDRLTQPSASLLSVARLPSRLLSADPLLFGLAAAAVGLLAGASVWVFKRAIDVVHYAAFGLLGARLASWAPWAIFLVPVLGGVLVGLLVHWLIGEERHHGVAGVIEAVALAGGRLRYRRIAQKALASAVSIGTGASVGPEDPSVQLGANLGSLVGLRLRLSEDRVRTLVAAGAGAGIAAAFNAPIAGIFFALEIVLAEMSSEALVGIILASVVSAVFTQAVSGPQPAFHVPAYSFHTAWELPLYLGLGLLAGPAGAAYIRLIFLLQDAFARVKVSRWIKTAVAGAGLGLVGLALPQVLGVGYDTIEKVLGSQPLPILLLVGLMVAKLVMTPWSLAGGFQGGLFAPGLFIGAMLGAAYAGIIAALVPSLGIAPAPFAMVGMAALIAAAMRAPLTAIVLLFEMTNDYRIILPLMFAVAVAMVLSERLEKFSVYGLALARKGVRLLRGRDVEVLDGIQVQEVMHAAETSLRPADTLATASEVLVRTRHHGLPVLDPERRLVGMLTLHDLDVALEEGLPPDTPIDQVASHDLVVAFPEESIGKALQRMATRDIGRLPVVSPEDQRQLLGILRRTDVIRAYELALSRRAAARQQAQESRLAAFSGAQVREFIVEETAPCEGKMVREVRWPHGSIVASLRRGGQVLVPDGQTLLLSGDVLVVVAEADDWERIRSLCESGHPQSPRGQTPNSDEAPKPAD